MKKIININLSGRLIPIEDTAYELLKGYLDSLARYFGREEGGEEIVSDIEDRIAELFQEKLKKGAHCITDQDVDLMIATMGRPEQLEEETSTEPQEKQATGEEQYAYENAEEPKRLTRNVKDKLIGGVCSGIANHFKIDPAIVRVITFILIWAYGVGLIAYVVLWIILPGSEDGATPLRRRLYRDTDHKVVGGVASGLAAYFKIDPVIPRILFILPLLAVIFTGVFDDSVRFWGFHNLFFPFSVGALPTLIVLYIILWIAVPKAVTQAEKLEMRGEKVDLQSLSNAYKSTGDEKKKIDPTLPGSTPASSPRDSVKKQGVAGEIFGTLVKIVLYFILAVIIISLCGVLIGLTGGFLGVTALASFAFPLKSLLLASPLQHMLAWPAILLTLGIPVVALIWILVKLITGFRPRFRYVGLSLFILWFIGVLCAISLLVSVGKDFRMNYSRTEDVHLTQPGKVLILKKQATNERIDGWGSHFIFDDEDNWLADFIQISEDSIRLDAVKLSVRKSEDSNYHVRIVRFSNGRTADQARHYASLLRYPIQQKDSVLYISDGFVMPSGIPFRNQHILLEVFVPEGKQIDFRDNLDELKEDYFDRDHWDEGNWEETDSPEVFHMSAGGGLVPNITIKIKEVH